MSISVAPGASPRREDGQDDLSGAVDVVRQLVSTVRHTSVRRLHVRTDRLEVEIEHDPVAEHAGPPAAAAPDTDARREPETGLVDVVAPTVGVVHLAAGPDGADVAVGTVVTPETEVAQVEAMKLITPVLAGCAGVVREVCCQDGDVVEFGQPLLRVRPGADGEDTGDATL